MSRWRVWYRMIRCLPPIRRWYFYCAGIMLSLMFFLLCSSGVLYGVGMWYERKNTTLVQEVSRCNTLLAQQKKLRKQAGFLQNGVLVGDGKEIDSILKRLSSSFDKEAIEITSMTHRIQMKKGVGRLLTVRFVGNSDYWRVLSWLANTMWSNRFLILHDINLSQGSKLLKLSGSLVVWLLDESPQMFVQSSEWKSTGGGEMSCRNIFKRNQQGGTCFFNQTVFDLKAVDVGQKTLVFASWADKSLHYFSLAQLPLKKDMISWLEVL